MLSMMAFFVLVLAGLNTGRVSAATTVPFKFSVSGRVSPTGLPIASTYALSGSGNASHLGNVSYTGTVRITSIDTSNGEISDTLTETLAGANGDAITLQCRETATQIGNLVFHGSDVWTVTNGTGRFSGARGTGTGDSHIDLNVGAGKFSKAATGTITY